MVIPKGSGCLAFAGLSLEAYIGGRERARAGRFVSPPLCGTVMKGRIKFGWMYWK